MRILLLLLVLLAATPRAVAGPDSYRFLEDGAPVSMSFSSLRGRPDEPTAGDVAWFRGHAFPFTLEGPGEYRLSPDFDRNLLHRTVGGKQELLVAKLPGIELSEADRRTLRGVELAELTKETAKLLKGLDLSRITVKAGIVHAEAIPPKLERLIAGGGPVGQESLAPRLGLRLLRIRWLEAAHANRFATLTHLRNLEVEIARNLDSVGFAAPLRQLRSFSIGYAKPFDVAPLAALPHLRELTIHAVPGLRVPPGGFPALRRMDLLYSDHHAEALAAFRRAHPACSVLLRRDEIVRAAAREADEVRLIGDPDHPSKKPLAVVSDAKRIQALLAALCTVDPPPITFFEDGGVGGRGSCRCYPGLRVEFRQDGRRVVLLGLKHPTGGMKIAWKGHMEAELTQESAQAVLGWLAEAGHDLRKK